MYKNYKILSNYKKVILTLRSAASNLLPEHASRLGESIQASLIIFNNSCENIIFIDRQTDRKTLVKE